MTERSKYWKILAASCLLVATVVDLSIDDTLLRSSADLSASLQEWGGQGLKIFGLLFSFMFAFVPYGFVYFSFLTSRKQLRTLHYSSVFFLSVTIGVLLKVIFYKGRPWAINDKVTGSSCDPGLPSGHAIMSVTGYYIMHKMLIVANYPNNKLAQKISAAVCSVIVFLVCVSRITLGDHGYNQLIIGALVAWTCIEILDYKCFIWFLKHTKGTLKLIMAGLTLASLGLLILFCYIDHEHRENYAFWTNISNDKVDCKSTFTIGAAQSGPIYAWAFGTLMFYSFRSDRIESVAPLGQNRVGIRVFIHFVSLLPVLIFMSGAGMIIADIEDTVSLCVAWAISMTVVFLYAAIAMVYISRLLREKLKLNGREDYIFWSQIEAEHTKLAKPARPSQSDEPLQSPTDDSRERPSLENPNKI